MLDKVQTHKSMCNMFLSVKSLLFFIYEIINIVVRKLSGNARSESITTNFANSQLLGNNNVLMNQRLKTVRQIPGPLSLPFFGTLLTSPALRSTDLFKVNEDRMKAYGSIVKEEHYWNFPCVNILDGEEMKKVLRSNTTLRPGIEMVLVYRASNPERYPIFGVVNTMDEAGWKYIHPKYTTITQMRFVRSALPAFNDIAKDTMQEFEKLSGPINYLETFNKCVGEAAFYTIFGKRVGLIGENRPEAKKVGFFANCHEMYWKAFHESMYSFPWWKYFNTKVWKQYKFAEDKLMDMITELINEYLQEGSEGGLLAEIKDKLPRQELYILCLEFLLGATEPVVQSITIALYWICKHEHISKRVFDELKEALPTKDSEIDEQVLDQIPFLKACVMESFRVCPTACNLARMLDTEMQIGKYKLPKYTVVILQTWYACMQDCHFYRAKEYLPDRWMLQDGVPPFRPHDRQLMCTFGMGSRACPGQKIALQLMYTYLCKILRKFEVKFTQDIDLQYEWLLMVQNPLHVKLTERDN